jgi:hypothetical protein
LVTFIKTNIMNKISLIITFLLVGFLSHAQWNSDTAINTLVASSNSGDMKSISTSSGQTYVVFWKVVDAPTNYQLRVQLLDAQGNQQFGEDGSLISDALPMSTFTYQWTINIDANDALYVGVTGTGNDTGFAYKVGIDGLVDWSVSNPNALAVKVLPLASGNTVVAWLNTSNSVVSMQKYDTDGAAIWSSVTSLSVASSPADLYEISSENIVLVYHLLGSGISSTLYAQRFDSDGNSLWSSATQLSNKTTAFIRKYDGVNDGDVVYYGYYGSSSSRFDSYLQRINPDGTLPWGINGADFDTSQTRNEMETAISFNAGSNFIWSVCTYRDSSQGNSGEYIQKFDTQTGERQFTDSGKQVFDVGSDNIHAGGLQLFEDQPLFLIKSGVDNGASPTTLNACFLDTNGDFVWPEETKPVATFSANKADVHFNKPVNGKAVTVFVENKGAGQKMYAQNFTDPLLSFTTFDLGVSLQFVNPIGAKLVLSNATEIETITVSNTLGQQILQQKVHAKVFTASAASWKPGVYFVSLTFENGRSKGIKILKK